MGVLSDPVIHLANMIRDCKPFAAWCGLTTWNATETEARIHIEGIGPAASSNGTMTREEMVALRPWCLLYPEGQRGYRFTRDAAPNCWSGNGSIIANFSRAYDPERSIEEHWREASALIEPVISNDDANAPGLTEMAAVAGYLAFRDLHVFFAGRTPEENRLDYGDAYDVVMVFEY
jgi:hypothetical protein